jgi:hypothetical protein
VKGGLIRGQTVSIDATTLEANAALKSIVRRDNGQGYEEYLKGLAQTAGMENPTREQVARFDRKRRERDSTRTGMARVIRMHGLPERKMGARSWHTKPNTRWICLPTRVGDHAAAG